MRRAGTLTTQKPLPPCGGGGRQGRWGLRPRKQRVVPARCAARRSGTPLPNPPPQGGREKDGGWKQGLCPGVGARRPRERRRGHQTRSEAPKAPPRLQTEGEFRKRGPAPSCTDGGWKQGLCPGVGARRPRERRRGHQTRSEAPKAPPRFQTEGEFRKRGPAPSCTSRGEGDNLPMAKHVISQLAHVELLSTDPDGSIRFFCDLLGMEESARDGRSAYLRAWGEHWHSSLKITEAARPGLGHAAWRANGPEELEAAVRDLEASGLGGGWIDGD